MGLDIRWPIGLMFTLIGVMLTIFGLATGSDLERYKASLGININLYWGLVLLVFGGSQGAVSLNRAVSGAAAELAAAGVAVLHAHGPKNTLDLREPQQGDPPYVAVPYLDRMDLAYAAADLVICRSGAMTVAEVSAVGLPAIYVPLPIGNGEQRLNALPVVNVGGGMLVADAALTPALVAQQVAGLLNDPDRLAAMTAAAAQVGHPEAARQVAQAALDIAKRARASRRRQ